VLQDIAEEDDVEGAVGIGQLLYALYIDYVHFCAEISGLSSDIRINLDTYYTAPFSNERPGNLPGSTPYVQDT